MIGTASKCFMRKEQGKNGRKRLLPTFSPLFLHFLFFVGFCHLTFHLEALGASQPQISTYTPIILKRQSIAPTVQPSQYKGVREVMRRLSLLASEIELSQNLEESELDEREREVLKFLSSEQNAYFSFQGLRRRLGFHQETLTRTLKRLEEARAIERSPQGYKLKGNRASYSFNVRTNQLPPKPIIDAHLPSQVDVTVLFQKLRGRWFSSLRWLGYSHDGEQLAMSWISEDGQMQLQARIGGGKIIIAADSLANNEESRHIAAAYQLFDHISKIAEEIVQHPTQTPIAN